MQNYQAIIFQLFSPDGKDEVLFHCTLLCIDIVAKVFVLANREKMISLFLPRPDNLSYIHGVDAGGEVAVELARQVVAEG